MPAGDTILGTVADEYHVEIRHPGGDWTHIHGPRWETTRSLASARRYATLVEQDHPGSEVCLVRSKVATYTVFRTGETRRRVFETEVIAR